MPNINGPMLDRTINIKYEMNNITETQKLRNGKCSKYHYNIGPSIPPQSEMMETYQQSQQSGDQTVRISQRVDRSLLCSTSNKEYI